MVAYLSSLLDSVDVWLFRLDMQIQRVVFTGNFLRRNRIAQQTVSYSLAKWSELSGGPPAEALFLKHEGYFGAVGAFLANHANAAGIAPMFSSEPVGSSGGGSSSA